MMMAGVNLPAPRATLCLVGCRGRAPFMEVRRFQSQGERSHERPEWLGHLMRLTAFVAAEVDRSSRKGVGRAAFQL